MTHVLPFRQQGSRARQPCFKLKDERKKDEKNTKHFHEKYQPYEKCIYTWQQVLQQAQYFQQQSSRSANSNNRNKRRGSSHRRLAAGQSEGSSQSTDNVTNAAIIRNTAARRLTGGTTGALIQYILFLNHVAMVLIVSNVQTDITFLILSFPAAPLFSLCLKHLVLVPFCLSPPTPPHPPSLKPSLLWLASWATLLWLVNRFRRV